MKKLLPLLALLALTACKQTTAPMAETPAVPDFDLRLRQCYEQAKADGILDGTYRITGTEEYFAEAIQDWFNVNAEMPYTDGKHNWCNTREELQQFAPDLYALLAEYFPNTKLQISKHKKVNEIGKY